MAKVPTSDNTGLRERIASIIAISIPIATGVLGIVGIVFAVMLIKSEKPEDGVDVLKYVFTALLPLWGTWIGTVLAYYFSKENFEVANRSVQKLVDSLSPKEKLQSALAKDIMIGADDLIHDNLKANESPDNLKIMDLRQKIIDNKIKRWPILQENIYRYIIHKSIFDEYLTDKLNAQNYEDLTIADMKKDGNDWIKRVLEKGAKFIPENATLYDAKLKMDEEEACNDVFITRTGGKNEPVLGWISNVDIANHGNY